MAKIIKKNGVLLLALSAAMALMLTGARAASYQDVAGHWAEPQIVRWSDLGYLTGYGDGTFGPNDPISRGQLTAILANLYGYTGEAENTFGIPEDAWYLSYVLRAAQAGILPDSWWETASDAPLTREEAMYIIAAAIDLEGSGALSEDRYTDGEDISDWAVEAVYAMTEAGYVGGFPDGGVHPQGSFTRAEVVTILNNIFAEVYNAPGTYSGDVTGLTVVAAGGITLRDMTVDGDLILTGAAAGQTVTLDHVTVTGEIVDQGCALVQINNEQFPGTVTSGNRTTDIRPGARANLFDPDRLSFDENGYASYDSEYFDAVRGIDVSSHQGRIDWQAVADSGVEFAMIRVGFRGYTAGGVNEDTRFEYNIQGALDAGLDVGVYIFSQAISVEEAREEARFVLERIAGYDITYPVVFDWETISGDHARTDDMDPETLDACAQAFCQLVEEAGYTPGVYFNTTLGYFWYDQSQLTDRYTWMAEYNQYPDFYYDYEMWQYSCTGTVPGIEGDVDLDLAFRLRD